LFVGIDILLAVRPLNTIPFPCDEWVFQAANGVTSSYDALIELFESLGSFLKRFEIYTMVPPTPIMIDIIVKIMIELLLVHGLATKQVKEGRFSKRAVTYVTRGSVLLNANVPQRSSRKSYLVTAR
jgi:hypothetical protein